MHYHGDFFKIKISSLGHEMHFAVIDIAGQIRQKMNVDETGTLQLDEIQVKFQINPVELKTKV